MAAIVSNVPLAGQNIGLVLPPLNDDRLFYGLALGLLVIATAVVWWLTRSRFGFGLIAIRENEDGAAVMGVNTTLYKVLAFALSGVLSSLAGGIHAYWITFLDPESAFDIGLNVKMIIMAVFGGAGTVLGPVIGPSRCRPSPSGCPARSPASPRCSSAWSSWCCRTGCAGAGAHARG
jgi:branched-chain amino acid transport system permease protein